MKKSTLSILSLLAILLIACNSESTKQESENSSSSFNKKSEEEGFAEAHDEPIQIDYQSKGEMEQISIQNADPTQIYSLKRDENINNYLILVHEWWGLNDFVKRAADYSYRKLKNVNVIAIDLYDGKQASKREEAKKLMQAVSDERAYEIIDGVMEHIGPEANIATLGWCFGGGWSMKTAIRAGKQTQGCVMYYGMPVQDLEELAKLNSDLLFIYGTQDNWIDQGVAEELKSNCEALNKEINVLAFDADHAFANPTQKTYNQSAAKEANSAAIEYLKAKFN